MILLSLRRFLVFLVFLAFFLMPLCICALGEEQSKTPCVEIVYGVSELGRDLICRQIGDASAEDALLLYFAVHGFEDAYDHDGEVLRLIADRVSDYFTANPDMLGPLCLYIIPTANPDGLMDGTSKDAFGRCNAKGLDINRDFPAGWREDYRVRYKTGHEPFASAEARAIQSLVQALSPAYAVDVHGWIDAVYGDGPLSQLLARSFDMRIKTIRSGGTLTQWLDSLGIDAALLELPPDPNEENYVAQNSEKLIDTICQLALLHSSAE